MKTTIVLLAAGLASIAAAATPDGEFRFSAKPGQPAGKRIRWQVPFEADLSACRGFEFDFRCPELALEARVPGAFIFTGTSGVYTTAAALLPDREWTHVKILKENVVNSERYPSGWSQVTSFQLNFFPDGTNGYSGIVKNVRPLPAQSCPFALLYPERRPGAELSSKDFTVDRKLAGSLADAGVDTYFVSDRDIVRNGVPPGVKVLFVSKLRRSLPEDLVPPLRSWLRTGGRIVHCINCTGPVLRPLSKEFASQFVDGTGLKKAGAAKGDFFEMFLRNHFGDFAETIGRKKEAMVAESRRQLREIASTPSVPGELCMVLSHTPWHGKGAYTNWEESVRFLKDCGINMLCVNFCRGLYAAYGSKVLKPWPGMDEKGDALELCKAACLKYGISMAAWRCCWITPDWLAQKGDLDAMKVEKRIAVARSGKDSRGFACPTHPENIRTEVEAIVELASKGVDWVVLDFIRYRTYDTCFCRRCRDIFEKTIGRKVDDWPKAVCNGGELAAQWTDFRARNISHMVKEAGERIHSDFSGVKLLVCGFSDPNQARVRVGQDWPLWCREGWIDGVLPMNYGSDTVLFGATVRKQKALDMGKATLYPLIGPSCWLYNGDDAFRVVKHIQTLRAAGCKGWGLFNLDERTEQICKILATGPTRPCQ